MKGSKPFWSIVGATVLFGLVLAILYSRQMVTDFESGVPVKTTDHPSESAESGLSTAFVENQNKRAEKPETELPPDPQSRQVEQGETPGEALQLLVNSLADGIEPALEFLVRFERCQSSTDLIVIAANQADVLEEKYPAYISGGNERKELDKFLISAEDREFECKQFLGKTPGDDGLTLGRMLDIVENEAGKGNSVAKFMYAMWAPNDRESYLIGLEAIQEHERKARAFVSELRYENVQLWLLSLGLSYSSGKNFTPMRTSIGSSYLLAANFCGLDLPIIEKQLNSNRTLMEVLRIQGISTGEEELAMAASRIAAENCH